MTSGVMQWVSADQVFDGSSLLSGYAVGFADGVVQKLCPASQIPANANRVHHDGLLTPGFFDIQVNGGGGVILNTHPSVSGIRTITAAHRKFGTTALMPTVITDAPAVLEAAVAAAIDAKDVPGFVGLHIEGPHISVARRGTHAARHIRPFDDDTLKKVRELRDADVPTLLTLAPEAATPADVYALRDMGAVVSIGHSDATAAETIPLLSAGARCFTHLFNAMSPMLNRSPGVTGTAIASDVYCSIIADGIHVDPVMVALAVRARPKADRMIAVSDAMATVGGPDRFDLYGQDIHLQDGQLVNAEGSLAGAHLTLVEALRNLVDYGVALEAALRMCRTNPFALLDMSDRSALIGQNIRDVVLLNDTLQLRSVDLPAKEPASESV